MMPNLDGSLHRLISRVFAFTLAKDFVWDYPQELPLADPARFDIGALIDLLRDHVPTSYGYATRREPPESRDKKLARLALEWWGEHCDLSARGSDREDSTIEPEFIALAKKILKSKTG
jgi:hypothetical protein